jgi:tRNA threonylcarbamoyladenosine biosynthesis protein TsaE
MEIQKTNNEIELMNIAKQFSKSIKAGDILILNGPLGAGKTTFVKGLALGLNIKQPITSPTFNIVKEYDDILCHIDAYRVHDEDIGIDHYVDMDFIICIEWAENIEDYIPYVTYQIDISYNEEGRIVSILERG